ncbi:MAG TPA: ABC transporter substrate-binding protein [Methylotenera sp.]|nr:ABC transporter substrate-binding protein [Methylotenera sp.]
MLKKFPGFLFAFLLVLPLLVACQKSAMPTQEIRFGIAQGPLNLDPRYATDAASERVNRLIYQPLVDFDAASKPIWILARRDTSSGAAINKLEYKFILQKPATFHNGDTLTARDVKATYDSLLNLKDSPHAAEFLNIDSIEVIDDKTLIFKLKQGDTHFISKLIIGILPKSLIEKNHDFSHNPVGSGPLKFESWQHDLKLKRISDNQLITLQEVKDPTVRVLKLKKGEIDLIQGDLPPELVKHLQDIPSLVVHTTLGANYSYLGLNMQDDLLKILKVRQAIAHAIDRQAIIDKVMVSNTRTAGTILPPEHYTNINTSINKDGINNQLAPYDYNPALAKKLLIEAGVKLPLKLLYKTSTDAFRVRLATIMQAQMAQAGITLEIKSLDWGTFFADVKAGNFQLYGLTWVGIKTPEIYAKAFGSNYFPPNGFNRGRYSDAELDKLLAAENWTAATQRIQAQLPYIPLWYEGQFTAVQKNIKNYVPKADGNWDDLATIIKNTSIK